MKKRIALVGVDPGSSSSGVAIILDGQIHKGHNIDNAWLFHFIEDLGLEFSVFVVIEDVMPYDSRLSAQLIDTCKFIGQLQWRLRDAGIPYALVPRSSVKRWVFEACYEAVVGHIEKRIARSGRVRKDGSPVSPSFIYVNDRSVIAGMKAHWSIPTPRPGKSSLYGLATHAWQALAVVTVWMKTQSPTQE